MTRWSGSDSGRPGRPPADDAELPDVVFYTGCNVLKTPHIALLCLDIMDAIGTSYKVMGGPSHCCGVIQLRAGDTETSSRFAGNTIGKLAPVQDRRGVGLVPELLRAVQREHAADVRARDRREAVRHDAVHAVSAPQARCVAAAAEESRRMKIALHKHPGVAGVMDAAEEIVARRAWH